MQGFGTIVVSDNCTINYEIPNAFTVELEIISKNNPDEIGNFSLSSF